MTRAELVELRLRVDAAVRARVAVENAKVELCLGCNMPRGDWTPGCRTCFSRHDNWIRGKYESPYVVDSVTLAAHVRVISAQLEIDRMRAAGGDQYRWAA